MIPLSLDSEHTISSTKSYTKDIHLSPNSGTKKSKTFEWFRSHRGEILERAENKFPHLDVDKGYVIFVEQVEAKGYKYVNHEAAYHVWLRNNLNNQFSK
jgi:hypothetical protein